MHSSSLSPPMSGIITPRSHLLKAHHALPSTTTTTTIAKLSPSDPSLHSTWSHRFWLTAGCATFLTPVTKSLTISLTSSSSCFDLIPPLCTSFLAFSIADLATGFYHWSIDNYGSSATPLVGSQIQAFQGHHKHPSTIAHRHFANNLHSLGKAITFTVLPLSLAAGDNPTALAFIGVCSGCIMFSQQFHAWAHEKKSRLPPLVIALQDAGVLVSRSKHSKHHRPPYNNNYCIVSGMWNEVLDEMKVFDALEMMLFFKLGVRPRSWAHPSSEWKEEDDDGDMAAAAVVVEN